MIGFAKRNLKVFFRDRASVFFSLLAVFIVIGVYALFLGDAWVGSLPNLPGVRYLMDSWIVAGLLAITSVTTTMGAFGIMVDDKTNQISKDFLSSPLKRSSIAGGYTLSAFLIGVIMSLLTLALAELYIVANGGRLLAAPELLQTLGMILLCTFANTSMLLFVVSFFRSSNAFGTASTVIGTIIGFLTGIYLPVGQLPRAVQLVIKVFPVSHAAALLRQILMRDAMSTTFAGAPAQTVLEFERLMGVSFQLGDTAVTPLMSVGVLALTAVVFYGLSVLSIARKTR